MFKSEYSKAELKFLGHIVGKNGIKVDPPKTAVIEDCPVPTDIYQVRSLLALATYFRRLFNATLGWLNHLVI